MSFGRGDVAWAVLDRTVGHEQAGRRPVLVLSNESISRPIGLAAVVPLTSWKGKGSIYPTEIRLPRRSTGLRVDSLALCHQLRTVSSERLRGPGRPLQDRELLRRIESAVLLWLDIRRDDATVTAT